MHEGEPPCATWLKEIRLSLPVLLQGLEWAPRGLEGNLLPLIQFLTRFQEVGLHAAHLVLWQVGLLKTETLQCSGSLCVVFCTQCPGRGCFFFWLQRQRLVFLASEEVSLMSPLPLGERGEDNVAWMFISQNWRTPNPNPVHSVTAGVKSCITASPWGL